jgi:uncharacterized membrane protein YqhA
MSTTKRDTTGAEVQGASFWLELAVYAALIVGYLLLVLKTLDRPLAGLYEQHRVEYAVAALMLILLQGIALELLTKILVGFFGRRAGRSR